MHSYTYLQNMSSSASAKNTQSDESVTDSDLSDICYLTGYNLIFEQFLERELKVSERVSIVVHVKNIGLDLVCSVAALEDENRRRE